MGDGATFRSETSKNLIQIGKLQGAVNPAPTSELVLGKPCAQVRKVFLATPAAPSRSSLDDRKFGADNELGGKNLDSAQTIDGSRASKHIGCTTTLILDNEIQSFGKDELYSVGNQVKLLFRLKKHRLDGLGKGGHR